MNDQTPQPRLTAADFDQELLDLYDYYAHGKISKREFLDRAGKWAVGGLTAAAILGTLAPITRWPSRWLEMIPVLEVKTSLTPVRTERARSQPIWSGRQKTMPPARPLPFWLFTRTAD
jgi:hypothetical protein